MNKKILIISGPTGVGKTKIALEIAKLYHGELISVDSRQVYKGMDVVTGKDTQNSQFVIHSTVNRLTYGYYEVDGIKLWGLDIVNPDP